MEPLHTLFLDGREVPINGERNLLELARKNGVTIPSFCYHSELSVYGACRLCLVDIEGRGIVTSCSTTPEAGLRVRTNTAEIREMRKIALELLLANHDQSCPTCEKSATCKLQDLARQMGVTKVRFKPTQQPRPKDFSSVSLVRDPNKCILCGDCVRACREIQGISAIDFAHRGANVEVLPAFGKGLADVECVNCGLCASVCPTGALTPRSEIDDVWKLLDDPNVTVVAQIAPAVRVAIGEHFGLKPGQAGTGQIIAALRRLGFDKVYDTCFTADLTVIEEAEEFLKRKLAGEKIPQFTSCCPAWVTFAEQHFPELLGNLSTCRSPQQMFGSVAKALLPEQLDVPRKNLAVISIMPCTAKKAEARRPEFARDGQRDVDHVLTTQELARMIEQAGLQFENLQPDSLDMPFGFKTGAGVIFGASGGVTEAVLRYAAGKIGAVGLEDVTFQQVRGSQQIRVAELELGDIRLKLAVVHGLRNAQAIAQSVRDGKCDYDLVEVMACPGGCIGGAGQPVCSDFSSRKERADSLYNVDKMLQLHKSQDNHMVAQLYKEHLGDVGGHNAHELLHTHYYNRRRQEDDGLSLTRPAESDALVVKVCVGTNCFVKGSQSLLQELTHFIEEKELSRLVDVRATFCLERCGQGPNVAVGDTILTHCTFAMVRDAILERLGVTAEG